MNANGLPNKDHYSTAYDIAQITKYLIDLHPELYKKYFSRKNHLLITK